MLSFTKFLNYLNDNPNYLKDEQKDSLHRILFCNPDNIFINNHKNSLVDIPENKQEISLVKIEDMKWYNKVWRRIINFFRK